MKQMMGISQTGNFSDAIQSIHDPKFLIIIAGEKETFEQSVLELEQTFPGVPSIGCVGQCYSKTNVLEKGLMIVGFSGELTVSTGILTDVSTMPMKRIYDFKQNLAKVNGNSRNTVCIDLCSGNDECVIATMQSILKKVGISLTGGTAWEGLVSRNGVVYEDACTYAFVKNNTGRIKVYRENIYVPTDISHMVTKSIPEKNILCELDGVPAEQVYADALHIAPEKITEQTFINPLGRCIGDEVYIISLKDRLNNKTFSCYHKTYPKDILNILTVGNYKEIVQNTIASIQSDFTHVSGIFSVNCIFRYLFFNNENYMHDYLQSMDFAGNHAGLIGLGEHYNSQYTNQTMSCVVFE